ncbi:MAG TPA: alpha/beta hydrolase [Actinophytocola sp.]|uniref:alpha/beta fold hydrolase n=1 Tax=Actinophytocola sp. TaxID=1872138 RepID=UPI002DB84C15|nr:alpha/beta hydrolase [Actinophytocola sp.]HEU5474642.1 alpha/beta hydrolase [Actinophytocola sp.]
MPEIERPDGARLYYEVHGTGFPVLLLAPGGPDSRIGSWDTNFYHPVTELSQHFQVIALDQRGAGRSSAPAEPFCYQRIVADQLAVLDALGIEEAHVVAAGSATAQAWRLAHDAPERVRAIVAQEPVGIVSGVNSLSTYLSQYDEAMRLPRAEGLAAVLESAVLDGRFAENPGAGPFAAKLNTDPLFREEILAGRRERYIVRVLRFRDGIWPAGSALFSVPEEWLASCPPVLVLPGNDAAHPELLAKRITAEAPNALSLNPDFAEPEQRAETVGAIVSFLTTHTEP